MVEKPQPCPKLRKLKALARKWGGSIVKVTEEEYDALQLSQSLDKSGNLRHSFDPEYLKDAPFSSFPLGVIYSEKKVVYAADTRGKTPVDPPWYEFIHEMGHVFACNEVPSKSKEYDFFGWEYAMALKFKAVEEWIAGNKDYSVADGDDLSTLSPKEVQEILEERLSAATSLGLVVDGEPVAIR